MGNSENKQEIKVDPERMRELVVSFYKATEAMKDVQRNIDEYQKNLYEKDLILPDLPMEYKTQLESIGERYREGYSKSIEAFNNFIGNHDPINVNSSSLDNEIKKENNTNQEDIDASLQAYNEAGIADEQYGRVK